MRTDSIYGESVGHISHVDRTPDVTMIVCDGDNGVYFLQTTINTKMPVKHIAVDAQNKHTGTFWIYCKPSAITALIQMIDGDVTDNSLIYLA